MIKKIGEIQKLDQIFDQMALTAFFQVQVFRNDKQNKIATPNEKWQKIIDGRWRSNTLRRYKEVMADQTRRQPL